MAAGEYLGPFIGYTDHAGTKIWMYAEGRSKVYISLYDPPSLKDAKEKNLDWGNPIQTQTLEFKPDLQSTGLAKFKGLDEDRVYYYKVWCDEALSEPFGLDGLDETDLYFRTMPKEGPTDRLDFILMSCHNPRMCKSDGEDGFKVWKHLPEILRNNEKVRFAILAGDQVYADDVVKQVLKEKDPTKRIAAYLSIYKSYWNNIHYRRVLCAIPSVLMWDDHDIMDGWGSLEASFNQEKPKEFKEEYKRLKEAATAVFQNMQASRNPVPVSGDGFDVCFRVGRSGFVLADLRQNRNTAEKRLWLPEQFAAVKDWVESERADLDTLFFVTPVTFAHGDPKFEEKILRKWGIVLNLISALRTYSKTALPKARNGYGLLSLIAGGIANCFDKNVGDLRDDINDGWGAPVNANQAQEVLTYLFDLQNPEGGAHPVTVVILSGDIHTAGYSTLYSKKSGHSGSPVINHIVASPVAYSPFPWLGEAYFRSKTKYVPLGQQNPDGTCDYGGQVSHHYCHRNVAVVSLRKVADQEKYLKVKFYLENWPEPQIFVFDLDLQRTSHLENIGWREIEKVPTLKDKLKKLAFVLVVLAFAGLAGFGFWKLLEMLGLIT